MTSASRTDADSEGATRIRRQEVVAELGQRALETDDLDRLLHDAATALAETLETEYASVLEVLPDDDAVLRQGIGWDAGLVGSATVPTDGDSQAGYALRAERPVVVDDLGTEDRCSGSELLADHDVASGVSVVVGSVDEPWGVLGTYSTETREFTEHDVSFVRCVANVLASAIENHRTTRSLREEKEQFRRLVEEVEDYAIFMLDPDGYVRSWNRGAEQIKGYAEAEIIGEHFSIFYPDDVAGERPDRLLAEAAAEGRTEDEGWRVRDDGSRFWASVSITALYDDDDDLRGFTKVTKDLTERREYERELEERERQFSTLMNDIPGLVYRCRNERGWPIEFVSDGSRELTGYDSEVIERGEVVWGDDVIVDTDQRDVWEDVQTAVADREPFTVTYRIETATGDRRWVTEYGRGAFDDTGELEALEGVVFDVTEQKRLEAELEKTFDRITDAFIGLDQDWNITYINDYGEELLDPEDRGLVGENFWDPFEPALGTTFEREYRTAMDAQEPTSFEEYYPPLGIWFEVHAYPSESGLSIYFRDITDRKERERRLEESERRYRTLAECFPNGLVTLFDSDLRYTLAAGQAFDELPVSPDDVEGGTPEDVWGEDVAAELVPALRSTLDGEEGETVEVEYAGRTWLIRTVPITDESGTVFSGMTMGQDVTERREMQRKLAESERRYRTLVEHFPNGAVALFDEELTYTVAGGELLDELGISSEDVVGEAIEERYPDELVDEVEPHFRAVFEGESDTFEAEYHGRHLRAHALPVRDANDEIYAGMLMIQDVSDQKEYQRKLEASNERLEQFAYAASHDMQEPLRMVSSYLSLIERRYGDDLEEDAEEFLEFAIDGAERMREMIDGLLEYSRVDTEGDPFEPVDLDAVLDDVLEDLQIQIEENDADLTIERLPTVKGDRSQLRQVFQNLLSNAITYSGDEPPEIRVDAERRGRTWEIAVHDEGVGIDPGDQDRVFEVFQRLHSREEYPGTGIGLALCQRIVERHGGRIRVDSEPGRGTTFSFTLPPVE